MKRKLITIVLPLLLTFNFVYATPEGYKTLVAKDSNGFTYAFVTNDPLKTRIYTLDNGLKVYLSQNKDMPRVLTRIVVKAGSKYDPPETTGLAHYLEHMMFKGTDKIATTDWKKERPLIEKISALYEKHRAEPDPAKKKAIYTEIDKISNDAAKYAVPNEFDRLSTSIGSVDTNAYTTEEKTVYINDIPSNEIGRWAALEKERFGRLVLRLFHTELETVYEEFNMKSDDFKFKEAIFSGLFKKHPYGTQTTIGKPEHLKNPSMVNIEKYWSTYYVPNNMAICMSGDIDYDATIKTLASTFGALKPNKDIPVFKPPVEKEIKPGEIKTVYGPGQEKVAVCFRIGGVKSGDLKYMLILDNLLSNERAGMIQLDLVNKQKLLNAGTLTDLMTDYGVFLMTGIAKEGQKLEEVKDILLSELEKVKKGDFDEKLLEAIVTDYRLMTIKGRESNIRVNELVEVFADDDRWERRLRIFDEMSTVTKNDLVEFTKNKFNNNFVTVYKLKGEDKTAVKVEKPDITPLDINRDSESSFCKSFVAKKADPLKPVFADFDKDMLRKEIRPGVEFDYVKNKNNGLFTLQYVIDMGNENDRKIPLAFSYLDFLGTSKFSLDDLQKELFASGLAFSTKSADYRTVITISGLDTSFEKGAELIEHILSDAKNDPTAYKNLVAGILKTRSNDRLNLNKILFEGMISYAKYGKGSPFRNILSEKELKETDPAELIGIIKNIMSYKHRVFYYGPREMESAAKTIKSIHKTPDDMNELKPVAIRKELDLIEPKTYFVDYDVPQVNILLLGKDVPFNKELIPYSSLYNEFYGSGLSSIVFQEMRESKGLAYSAFSTFALPRKSFRSYYLYNYVGTQSDKMTEALETMKSLVSNMPDAKKQFEASKESILKTIESARIINEGIFATYMENGDLGIKTDYRKEIYEKVKNMTYSDMEKFFNDHIKNKKYALLILGRKKDIDMSALSKYGKVEELDLNEIFGY